MNLSNLSLTESKRQTQATQELSSFSLPRTSPSAQWQGHEVSVLGSSVLKEGNSLLSLLSQGNEGKEESTNSLPTQPQEAKKKIVRFIDPTVSASSEVNNADRETGLATRIVIEVRLSALGDRSGEAAGCLVPEAIMRIAGYIDDNDEQETQQATMQKARSASEEDWSDVDFDDGLSSWERAGQLLAKEEARKLKKNRLI